MAVTIAAPGTGPGVSATRKVFATSGRTYTMHPFTVTFDSSYPTGGELIDTTITGSPWAVLTTVDRIVTTPLIAPGGTGGLTSGHTIVGVPDITNKKLILSDNSAEVANTTACQLIVIPCVAFGFQ